MLQYLVLFNLQDIPDIINICKGWSKCYMKIRVVRFKAEPQKNK